MEQAALMLDGAPLVARAGDPDGLRDYQRRAVEAVRTELQKVRSTLVVMPTGTGKTQTFGAVVKHWKGRVLIIAHRTELIDQADKRLEQMTGHMSGREKADRRAAGERVVVASIQSLKGKRLTRFPVDSFSLIVIDEAHHALARTYRSMLNHFVAAKVLGVTATPDRGDERAMEQVFDSVAFKYDIDTAIADGWLCSIGFKTVSIDAVDLSRVKTVAGDLDQGQLDAIMSSEEALHGVVVPTLELAGARRTIIFTTSVDNAKRMAEIFNRYRGSCARSVDGGTDEITRRETLRAHAAGEYQFLINVGVLTEGYDDPLVACIVNAAPTKSRALYAQRIGRGLRIHRDKVGCLLLDFTGDSGRHSLVTALDILGGKWDAEVIARAKEESKKSKVPIHTKTALERARAALALERLGVQKREKLTATVQWKASSTDPFAVLGVRQAPSDARGQLATPGQVDALHKFGLDVPLGLTRNQASKLIKAGFARIKAKLSTYRQIKALARSGIDATQMYFATASRLMDWIMTHNRRTPDQETIARIIAQRTAGEDG